MTGSLSRQQGKVAPFKRSILEVYLLLLHKLLPHSHTRTKQHCSLQNAVTSSIPKEYAEVMLFAQCSTGLWNENLRTRRN